MNIDFKNPNIYKAIALLAATIIFLSGMLFIISWHLGFKYILNMPPSIEMVSYASSVNILLAGLAIFSLFIPTRIPFANIFGAIILLITLSRFVELIFNVNFSITEFMSPWLAFPEGTQVPMPGVIAIGFLFIGLVLVGTTRYKRYQWQSTFLMLGSLIVFLLGASAATSYYVPKQFSFIWHGTPLNFQSQIVAMIIGIGLMAECYYFDIISNVNLTNRLPIFVTAALALLTILVSWSLALEKAHFADEYIKLKFQEVKRRAEGKIKDDVTLLKKFSSLIEADKAPLSPSRKVDISTSLQGNAEVNALDWVDANMMIRYIIPETDQEKLNSILPIPSETFKQLKEAIIQKKTFITTIPKDNDNDHELLIINPVYWEQNFQGIIVLVVDLKKLSKLAFNGSINDFALALHEGKKKIFSINDGILYDVKNPLIQDHLTFENFSPSIIIQPSSELLNSITNKTLIYTILLAGFATALTSGALIHFWQLSRSKILEEEKIKKQLLEAKKEQQDILKSAKIGTWSWNLKTNEFFLDEFTLNLLGIKVGEFSGTYQDFLKRTLPEDREHIQQHLRNCFDSERPIDCSCRIIWPDETVHWIVAKGKLFFDEKGNREKMTGISWEITSTKYAQLLLQVSEAISKILSENLSIPETFDRFIQTLHYYLNWGIMILWLVDKKTGKLQLTNISHIPTIEIPEFEKATNNYFLKNELSSLNYIWSTYRPIWYKDVSEDSSFTRHKEAKKEGIKGCFAFPIIEGSQIIGILELFKLNPFVEEVNEVLLNLMTSLGISIGQYIKRKAALDSLSAEEKRFRDFVEATEEWFWEVNADLIFTYTNPLIQKVLGYTPEEILGTPMLSLIFESKRKEMEKQIQYCLYNKQGWSHFITAWKHKDGSIRWLEGNAHPIMNEYNEVIGFRGVDHDITEHMLIEKSRDS